jgi:glycosyltransferase involved in cell wall biosynthesis
VNTIDNEAWAARAAEALSNPEGARSRWKLPEKYFLAVGRQIPKKNFAQLIRAYGNYRASSGDGEFDLVIVGDGPLRKNLQAFVREHEILGVHFHPFRKPDELGAYYALSSALVLPSLGGETWGNVVNEAMACGLPVLVSRECGCAQTLVHEGLNGWTFDPMAPEALANLLAHLEQMKDSERSSMGEASRRIIAQWGLDRFVEGVQAALRAVGADRRGFVSPVDRVILTVWNGRYRPT